jgi:hypothetical protein
MPAFSENLAAFAAMADPIRVQDALHQLDVKDIEGIISHRVQPTARSNPGRGKQLTLRVREWVSIPSGAIIITGSMRFIFSFYPSPLLAAHLYSCALLFLSSPSDPNCWISSLSLIDRPDSLA